MICGGFGRVAAILSIRSRRTRSTFLAARSARGLWRKSIVSMRSSTCHFHIGLVNPNRRAKRVAARFGKPLIATSDAHRLRAFGRHYTSMPMPAALTIESVFAGLRSGPLHLTSPPSSLTDFVSAIYFVFLAHPFRVRRKLTGM